MTPSLAVHALYQYSKPEWQRHRLAGSNWLLRSTPRTKPIGLGLGLRIWVSNKLLGDGETAGLDTRLRHSSVLIATVFPIWVPFYGYTIKNHSLKNISSKGSSWALLSLLLLFSLCHAVLCHAISPAFGPGLQRRTTCGSTLPASQRIPWPQTWGPWGPRALTRTVPAIL